jgi:hypothetical protein
MKDLDKSRRFETWSQIVEAVTHATAYWNAYTPSCLLGHHCCHQPRRPSGIAMVSSVRCIEWMHYLVSTLYALH